MYQESMDISSNIYINSQIIDPLLPNLWLIHGFTESSEYYESVFKSEIAKLFNIFSLDLPGFGKTPYEKNHDLNQIEKKICALINKYCPHGNIYLAGHSLGGTIATLIALLFSGSIKLLINIDGLLFEDVAGICSYSHVNNFSNPNLFKKFMIEKISGLITTDKYIFHYINNIKNTDKNTLYAWSKFLTELLSKNILEKYLALKCAKIYLYGENSINRLNIEKIKLMPQINQHQLQKLGHWPMLENSFAFNKILGSILLSYVEK